MSDEQDMAAKRDEPPPTVARLTELMTRRLQSDEPVDANELVKRYPTRVRSIRVLLPTLRDLVKLGRSVSRKSAHHRP